MKKLFLSLNLGIFCLIFFTVNSANAYTYTNTNNTLYPVVNTNLQIPVMQATVTNTANGTNITYSRPVIYVGSRVVKLPRYYRECKRKLGYWDENLCAQIYMPKIIQEKFADVIN